MGRIVYKERNSGSVRSKAIDAVFADFEERFGLEINFIVDMVDAETYVGSKRVFNFEVGTNVYYYLTYDTNSGEWRMEVSTLTDYKIWRDEI